MIIRAVVHTKDKTFLEVVHLFSSRNTSSGRHGMFGRLKQLYGMFIHQQTNKMDGPTFVLLEIFPAVWFVWIWIQV